MNFCLELFRAGPNSRLIFTPPPASRAKNLAIKFNDSPASTTTLTVPLYPNSITMASRFFHGDSSSESSSSDEEELYSDKEEEEEASEAEDSDEDSDEAEDESSSSDDEGGKKSGVSKFLRDAESESESDSDEDVAKVVKSAKDKRFEELEGTVKAIENGEKINDWHVISAGRFGTYFQKYLG